MASGSYSGAKYSNGNHKSQQKAYNKSTKGKSLIRNAQRLRASLKIPKGSPYDAAHYKGSKTKGGNNTVHLTVQAELSLHDTFTSNP